MNMFTCMHLVSWKCSYVYRIHRTRLISALASPRARVRWYTRRYCVSNSSSVSSGSLPKRCSAARTHTRIQRPGSWQARLTTQQSMARRPPTKRPQQLARALLCCAQPQDEGLDSLDYGKHDHAAQQYASIVIHQPRRLANAVLRCIWPQHAGLSIALLCMPSSAFQASNSGFCRTLTHGKHG